MVRIRRKSLNEIGAQVERIRNTARELNGGVPTIDDDSRTRFAIRTGYRYIDNLRRLGAGTTISQNRRFTRNQYMGIAKANTAK